MNIYHLVLLDNEDHRYDMHVHYSHPTKTGTELWEDYHSAFDSVLENIEEWTIQDVLDKLREMGWKQVETKKVEVSF